MWVGGQRHASAALPQKKPDTYCREGWVGHRAGRDGCGKSRPNRDSIPGPSNPYRSVNPFHLDYKNQSVYAVSGTSRCLFSDKYKTHKYSVSRAYSC